MKYSVALAALAAVAAASPAHEAVSSAVSPSGAAPSGCSYSYPGTFSVSTVNATTSRTKRQAATLQLTLNNGTLKDAQGRTGYIASNRQFQFDGPPQAGAIYTAGFSVCQNGTLALGGSAVWYSCLSGEFSNLYDQSVGGQCSRVYIQAVGGPSSASAGAGQASDGQPTASTRAASSGVSQIADGQPQANTAAATSTRRVSQISDGQIQASNTAAQATSSAPRVTQISDGQIQATNSAPRATTASSARVSQISDGQIQAATSARNATAVTTRPAQFTGAAAPIRANELFAVAAGLVGAVAMF